MGRAGFRKRSPAAVLLGACTLLVDLTLVAGLLSLWLGCNDGNIETDTPRHVAIVSIYFATPLSTLLFIAYGVHAARRVDLLLTQKLAWGLAPYLAAPLSMAIYWWRNLARRSQTAAQLRWALGAEK